MEKFTVEEKKEMTVIRNIALFWLVMELVFLGLGG